MVLNVVAPCVCRRQRRDGERRPPGRRQQRGAASHAVPSESAAVADARAVPLAGDEAAGGRGADGAAVRDRRDGGRRQRTVLRVSRPRRRRRLTTVATRTRCSVTATPFEEVVSRF